MISRNVLSWKLSNSLDTEFRLDALEMALDGGRKPGVFYSDQGCQFTSSNGLGGDVATTICSLNDLGERSNTKWSTFTPAAVAGWLKSTWPASYGKIATKAA